MPNSIGGPIFHGNNRGLYIVDRLAHPPGLKTVAADTLELTAGSSFTQFFSGTTPGQIVAMPEAITILQGQVYDLWNFSSQNLEVRDFSGTFLATLKPNARTVAILTDATTSAGVWALTYTLDSGNVFGTQLYYQEQNAETSNNSTTYANKVTLVTPSLPLGDYLSQFQFNWRTSAANRVCSYRVQRNAGPVDSGEAFIPNTQERMLVSGFRRVSNISGVQTYTLDFRRGATSTTVFMFNARLFVWRVG